MLDADETTTSRMTYQKKYRYLFIALKVFNKRVITVMFKPLTTGRSQKLVGRDRNMIAIATAYRGMISKQFRDL